jgi:salicylate biosynthesis isochorismate synthase/menaquinone-specific isochorismate synthase
VGSAIQVVSRGEDRFTDLAERCARAIHDRVAEEPGEMPAGAGPVWATGFAFAARGGTDPLWSSLPPALATMPEIALARGPDGAFLTASIFLEPGTDPSDLLKRAAARIGSLRAAVLTPADPHPSAATRIVGRYPPHRYERIVASAVERIRSTSIDKVVLARELTVEAPAAHDPTALFGALRELFPSCFCFCVGTGQAAFLGASPELLVRRSGAVAATVALAGTTARSADPAVDDHLGEQLLRSDKNREEQAIVTRRIVRALRPVSVWVTAAEEPVIARMANIQHLATPIRAQLARPVSAVELAGLLHPTPAVGGEPFAAAEPLIPALEGLDRGWYAGPVGWTDANEDGEFCVALRCALLTGAVARCYAGVGVMGDSDPAAELAETEVKLQALLPVLAG